MNREYIRKLREVLRKFEQEIYFQNHASCCDGISLAQCHTLLEIEKQGVISVTDLAGSLSLDKSTVSRTVDGLVRKHLVNRFIPRENRRLAMTRLTESGHQACSSIHSTNDSYFREIMKDFTPEEREEFLELFGKLTRNMEKIRDQNKEADTFS
jgi:DNA-binding MarR family transcriptional regulator